MIQSFFGGWELVLLLVDKTFFNPTSPPRSPIGSVPCVPSYTLSFPAFKGVTREMSIKHTSPLW